MSKTHIVALYLCDRSYGGPEEGGWWYDTGTLVRVVRTFPREDKAFDYARRLNAHLHSTDFGPNKGRRDISSVCSDGQFFAEVHEDKAPEHYPDQRPHYE